VATNRNDPADGVVKGAEVTLPFPFTATCETNTGGPEQVVLSGPNTLKVMVPVGLTPPLKVALSVITPPTGTAGEATVVMATLASATVNRSVGSLHPKGVVIGAKLASPLKVATKL